MTPTATALLWMVRVAAMIAVSVPAPSGAAGERALPDDVVALRAEGYGARTQGGAGGRRLTVTHLEDRGPGSLRAALSADGPRQVVFQVGGTIRLERPIVVRSGRLTVDGLTAASRGGITVEGGITLRGVQDVILRHLRLRGGYDPLAILESRRVLVDHVSAAWATDENIDVWNSHEVTLQWCILAEGLADSSHAKGPHSMGSLQGGGSRQVTTHHCLFTGNVDRNPLVYGPRGETNGRRRHRHAFDVLNNVVYNYWHGVRLRQEVDVNIIGNTFRPGPDTGPRRPEILVHPGGRHPPRVWVRDNWGPHLDPRTADPASILWVLDLNSDDEPGQRTVVADVRGSGVVASRRFRTPRWARVRVQPRKAAFEAVLSRAGAWPRDAEDERLVREVREGTGRIGRAGRSWRRIYGID